MVYYIITIGSPVATVTPRSTTFYHPLHLIIQPNWVSWGQNGMAKGLVGKIGVVRALISGIFNVENQ